MRAQWGFASGGVALCLALALAGCGGGGSDSGGGNGSPQLNRAPTAHAGADQTAKRNATVTLDGTASADADGDTLAYHWVQIAGEPVALSSATSSRPTFTTPGHSGILSFALTASDGKVDSAVDGVTITIQNAAPTAVAPLTITVGLGQMAVLDGTASTDPDGDPLTYNWGQLVPSPITVKLSNSVPGISEFRAPTFPQVLHFGLMVSDGEAESKIILVTVNVTVEATPPVPPNVYAGEDIETARRSTVTLGGWAGDLNGDSPLSYSWEQVSGPAVPLANAHSLVTTFTAPETPGELRFAFRASDGTLTSDADEVVVNVKNFAPRVSDVAITPTAAYTTDTLIADAQVVDPDNDALTTTYEWRRNGAVVGSQTSNTFPASLTIKNDVIAMRMTVDDGQEQATVDASTVIRDSPAAISAQTPAPTTLNYGDTATFSVSATDADGDAISGYEVAYGPAGFSVTPTGDVSWTAAGPLFDKETDFNWGVRVIGDTGSLLSGTIKVTDAAREYPLLRTNLSIPVQHSGLRIADLDGDGHDEMLVGSSRAVYVLSRSGATYQQSWVYPFDASVGVSSGIGNLFQSVTSADIDGDGKQEIYFSKGGQLVRLDGITRRESARTALFCNALDVADLDGNGTPELVCLDTSSPTSFRSARIFVLNSSTLATIWSTPQLELGHAMAVGNVDADAALEIVTSGGFVYDGGTHQSEWSYGQAFGDAVDTGDLDSDGVEEIISMADWSDVRAYSAVLKSQLWSYAPRDVDLDTIVVADANGDGRVEAIVGNAQGGSITGIGYNTTTQQPELLWETNTLESGVSSIAVGDVDADGANEVVWGTGAGSSGRDQIVVAGFTPTVSVKWRSGLTGELNGPFFGGELARIGGGAKRLLFSVPRTDSGYSGTRVVALTPMTGEVESSDAIGDSTANNSPAAVADYDNDGIDELFFGAANGYAGYFAAYDFAAKSIEWQSPQFPMQQQAAAVKQADMNGDGYADLVGLTSGGYVEIHDVHAGSLIWRSTQLGQSRTLALGDLDSDGDQEIVVETLDRLIIYGKGLMGTTYVERASIAMAAANLVVADLDGDSEPEIYAVTSSGGNHDPALSLFDTNLQVLRSVPLGVRPAAMYVEQSAFARKNLLIAVTRETYISPDSEVWAIDPVTGADVWRSPLLIGVMAYGNLHFADVDSDGDDEIVFGTYWGMYHTR